MRSALTLLVVAAAVTAGQPEQDVYLESDSVVFVHELAEPAAAVELGFEFRFGLYRVSAKGGLEPAVGGLMLEFNDADRAPDPEGNPFLPAEYQPEDNDGWFDHVPGNEPVPGQWLTEDRTTAPVGRRLVFRFPEPGRYRLRVTGIFGDTNRTRRVPTLISVAPLPEEPPEPAAGEDVVVEEPPPPEVVRETVIVEEPVYVTGTVVVDRPPPVICPFCLHAMICVIWHDHRPFYYSCRHCSGALHYGRDGHRRASIRFGGRRHYYDYRHGRAIGYRRTSRPHHRATREEAFPARREPGRSRAKRVERPAVPPRRESPRPDRSRAAPRRPERSAATRPVIRPRRPVRTSVPPRRPATPATATPRPAPTTSRWKLPIRTRDRQPSTRRVKLFDVRSRRPAASSRTVRPVRASPAPRPRVVRPPARRQPRVTRPPTPQQYRARMRAPARRPSGVKRFRVRSKDGS